MAGAFLLLCSLHFVQKAQRSWRCCGSCGLVGLGWEHAKTMCMCIPPSKTQRDTNPTPDSVWTSAPVVKTCWRPAFLILGRRELSRN